MIIKEILTFITVLISAPEKYCLFLLHKIHTLVLTHKTLNKGRKCHQLRLRHGYTFNFCCLKSLPGSGPFRPYLIVLPEGQ